MSCRRPFKTSKLLKAKTLIKLWNNYIAIDAFEKRLVPHNFIDNQIPNWLSNKNEHLQTADNLSGFSRNPLPAEWQFFVLAFGLCYSKLTSLILESLGIRHHGYQPGNGKLDAQIPTQIAIDSLITEFYILEIPV